MLCSLSTFPSRNETLKVDILIVSNTSLITKVFWSARLVFKDTKSNPKMSRLLLLLSLKIAQPDFVIQICRITLSWASVSV